jgi:hypothetical protein
MSFSNIYRRPHTRAQKVVNVSDVNCLNIFAETATSMGVSCEEGSGLGYALTTCAR